MFVWVIFFFTEVEAEFSEENCFFCYSCRTLSHKNHIVEAAVVQETHPLTAVPAAAVLKVGSKSGVDISDPGNINGVSSIDFNIAALNEEDKPWKKPGKS